MPALVLDGFVFEGFEIPEEVALGGEQAGEMNKVPGGARVYDASGPDDSPICWSGRVRGSGAVPRAMALDGMRRGGQMCQLSVLGLSYAVVIRSFRFKVRRAYEVEYQIELWVIADQGQGLAGAVAATLDSVVSADLASGLALLGSAPVAVSTAVAGYQSALATAGRLQSADLATLAPTVTSGAAASALLDSTLDALDAAMANDAFDPTQPDRGASAMQALLASMNEQSDLAVGTGYLARSVKNLANATG